LQHYCQNYRKTVILITHNNAIAKIANRIFYLKDGRLNRIETNEQPLPPEKVTW